MSSCGIGVKLGLNCVESRCYMTSSIGLVNAPISPPFPRPLRKSRFRFNCRAYTPTVSPIESEGMGRFVSEDMDLGPVTRFPRDDFAVSDRVSVGLGGKADELVFEAIVKNMDSPLYNTRVLLRELTSAQAQRRGRRAIEVLTKLAHRKLLYLSYSMQVHGFISPSATGNGGSFTLYHGSFSLRHWLQQSDWLPTLEATLALDEESVKKVGDDSIGGPEISRQLRIIRILMRDLLIGVNYLHSHGLAHTELRVENVHISPVDRHIKVGILGNAADFNESGPTHTSDSNIDRRQMMIAFDVRCLGFIMAKMVLRELMDPLIFARFKSFLMKGNDASCLREFLLPILTNKSPNGNAGLQILDRNWGEGWNLLSLLLAAKPSKRISCLEALRHPFLCGPRWRTEPSMNIIRWGLGSTVVRITEEYIYGDRQRIRLAHFIELMEMLNPNSRPKNWMGLLPGRWRLLYCTGRHIGLTLRQPPNRVLIGDVHLGITNTSNLKTSFSFTSEVSYKVMAGQAWPHDKTGIAGSLKTSSSAKLRAGRRHYYVKEEEYYVGGGPGNISSSSLVQKQLSGKRWRKAFPFDEIPSSLPVVKLVLGDVELSMDLTGSMTGDVDAARRVLNEVRLQVPPEVFDVSKIVCGTYVDSRLLVLRSVNGSALLFTRSSEDLNP
ncbi:hypothetical protein V2J09_016691 [Rumex salicifolius]